MVFLKQDIHKLRIPFINQHRLKLLYLKLLKLILTHLLVFSNIIKIWKKALKRIVKSIIQLKKE